jgi:site-specific DNA-cytosine methylase
MSINILETVQQNLGYPALQKIDPNTQQVVEDNKTPDEHKFSQAAIPAVLTALYKYVESDAGAEDFLRGDNSSNWVSKIFDDNKKEAIQKISAYAKQSNHDPIAKMNAIANEAVKVVKENLSADAPSKDVKIFFNNQKNNILLYLPAELNMGELLNDTTLDDKTNKMEGPMSSLMQSIGNAFSGPVSEEEIKTP